MTIRAHHDRHEVSIHGTAEVSDGARIGSGTRIWNEAQVREGATIGEHCIVGMGVYVDVGVRIGNRCKLENGVFVFQGFSLEDGVFLGPGSMLLNDLEPRAINLDGALKTADDWVATSGSVLYGASVGGGSIILPGVTVGRFAMVGAGSVVTRDVVDHGLVYGNPARLRGFVCECGRKLVPIDGSCPSCGRAHEISGVARSQVVDW